MPGMAQHGGCRPVDVLLDKAHEASLEDLHSQRDSADVMISPEMRTELLDPKGWQEVLDTYGRTMGLAMAMTDSDGQQAGDCHNPQPAWLMAHGAKPAGAGSGAACSFCLDSPAPCRAVTTALSTGKVQVAYDRAGFVHLAVPLSLGQHGLGAIIAGQVFDRYPEPLRLERLARALEISGQQLWQQARLQAPIRNATLRVYGELLLQLGRAFLRQRYAAILVRQLARANLRLRLLLEGIKGHALFTVDGKGCVTSWNLGAERLFGSGDLDVIGQNFSRFFAPEEIQRGLPGKLLQRAHEDGAADDEGWQIRKDGTRFFAESSLVLLGEGAFREFGRLTHDITERRSGEEALRQSQKLESIGVLASGIAHDFNNLLCGIMGGVSLAQASLPLNHPASAPLVIAEQTAEKAADLAHQLLAYSGQGKFIVTRFDLSVLIQDMLRLLKTSIPATVQLQLELKPDLPWIEADASQIQQVVMNLVINGAESMEPKGGVLRVSTAQVLKSPAQGDDGTRVCMEVQDSGSGMTEATKARIFDPFFTTKFTGRGLGLAAVSGIVRGHQGTMDVESAIGKGSTFRISFPGIEKPAPGVIVERTDPVKPQDEPISGTVLVVDDQPELRKLARQILERFGYTVLVAGDGQEAVDLFRQHADTVTAILLDMTMPVMSGAEAFGLLRAIRADVPIVVSTGFGEESTRELLGASTVVGFVQKPYTAARLCERIQTTTQVAKAVRDSSEGRNANPMVPE